MPFTFCAITRCWCPVTNASIPSTCVAIAYLCFLPEFRWVPYTKVALESPYVTTTTSATYAFLNVLSLFPTRFSRILNLSPLQVVPTLIYDTQGSKNRDYHSVFPEHFVGSNAGFAIFVKMFEQRIVVVRRNRFLSSSTHINSL